MRNIPTILYVVAMILVVIGVDISFFRGGSWTWERLMVNIGTVLVFAAFYFRFLKGP